MGKRTGVYALVLCVLLTPLNVSASTASELYETYNMECDTTLPVEITDTIKSYNSAKKYATQYTYVVKSEFDTSALQLEHSQIENLLKELENELLSGYSKDIADIYAIEDEYLYLQQRLLDIESTLQSYTVEAAELNVGDVPSYSEYKEALQNKNEIIAKREIGNLNIKVPVQSLAKCITHSDEASSYKVIDSTGVLSTFNGEVKDVILEEDNSYTVTIDNFNGIETTVANLESVDVIPGDTVYQNQRIGYVLGSKVVFKLCLNGVFVDISQIFVEESL